MSSEPIFRPDAGLRSTASPMVPSAGSLGFRGTVTDAHWNPFGPLEPLQELQWAGATVNEVAPLLVEVGGGAVVVVGGVAECDELPQEAANIAAPSTPATTEDLRARRLTSGLSGVELNYECDSCISTDGRAWSFASPGARKDHARSWASDHSGYRPGPVQYGAGMRDLALAGYADSERDRIVETLLAWLRIPSISAHPDRAPDVSLSADFCAGLMRGAGLEHVAVLDTGGGPAVYGDWLHAGDAAPTVLVYGHHDVQPVDPLDEWRSPPFEPVIVDGECLARGAIDDKGQTLYQIEAARGLLVRAGAIPVNLKLLVEGEEEVGSPNFERLLTREKDLFACDVVVVSDTGMISPEVPSTTVGMRGMVQYDVTIRTASIDLHSGMWGGAVPNSALIAARLAAGLHDEKGRVTLPGFYDDVRELSGEEKSSIDAQPFDEAEFRAAAGGVAYLEGEAGYAPLEQIGVRPTAEVVGIHSGYGGPGIRTIVPGSGGFKVAFRLVPDQRPERIDESFRSWIAERAPSGANVEVTNMGAVSPALTPVDHPAMGALARTIEKVWGKPPLYTREGGSGPEEALGRVLAAPVLFLGVGLPGDRIHAPNERMVMDQFWKGLLAAGELLIELGGN
jgi:acetylornithine deacetylase/succinyl-diaminopimelate desuccinylase-like protein